MSTPEELWAEIVAARMTGEPMPFDKDVWEPIVKQIWNDWDGDDREAGYCWAWQQGYWLDVVMFDDTGEYVLDKDMTIGGDEDKHGITVRLYRQRMIEKYQPKELEKESP